MLKKEFEDRIGRTVTADEYELANELYMEADDINKDDFCAEYKNLPQDSKIAEQIARKLRYLQDQLRRIELEREGDGRRLLAIANEVREGGMEASADQLDDFGSFLAGGRAEGIKEKLAKGYQLSQRDLDYIKNNIK